MKAVDPKWFVAKGEVCPCGAHADVPHATACPASPAQKDPSSKRPFKYFTDNAQTGTVAVEMFRLAIASDPDARIFGSIRAADIQRLARWVVDTEVQQLQEREQAADFEGPGDPLVDGRPSG